MKLCYLVADITDDNKQVCQQLTDNEKEIQQLIDNLVTQCYIIHN